LGIGLGEAIEHPSVNDTVGLLEASVNESENDLIGNIFSLIESLLHTDFNGRVCLLLVTDQLLRAHGDKSESLSDDLGLRGTSRAGGSDENNLWWSTGSSVSESNT
jgi:hypothetical protein